MRNIGRTWSACSLTGLTFALTVAQVMLLFSSSATSQGGREAPGARFEFALIGDMPYDARQEKELANVMREIDAAELAFVVHDGDFWYDGAAWTEQVGGALRAVTRRSSIVWVWLKAPNILSYSWLETTSGPIVTGQSRARMTRLRDWQSSARCFSKVIRALVGAPYG